MKKNAVWLLFCLALLLPHRAWADDDTNTPLSGTVTVGSIEIKAADVSLTPKDTYVHVLFDAFPYREAMKLDTPDALPLGRVAEALTKGFVLPRLPATKLVKVDVVEFTVRDDYGAANWGSVKRLGKFEVKITKRRLSVRRLSGPDIVH